VNASDELSENDVDENMSVMDVNYVKFVSYISMSND
jgi:hypothetical protein